MTDEFLAALEQILEEGDVPQGTINRIAIVLAMEANNQVQTAELQHTVDMAELKALIQQQSENISRLSSVVDRHEAYIQTHPSLLYLLRFRTRETAVIIVLFFVVLSIWWVSGFRRPILKYLGLPVF